MNKEDLKNSILQLAVQGKLVEQREEEGTAEELYEQIQEEKQRLIETGVIRKQKKLPEITEEEELFDIPDTWKWIRLGEVGEWRAGSTPTRSNPAYYGGNIPWLKTGDLTDGYIEEASEYVTDKALNETSIRLNPVGSVLMAMYGATIGKLGILNIESTTNQACCACVPFEGVYNKYLFYYLMTQRSNFIKMGAGGAQPNISRTKIVNHIIPLAPLEEQKRIVYKIEELTPYVEKYGEAYEKVTELNKQFPKEMEKSILQYAMQGKLVEQREEEGTAEELYRQIQGEKQRLMEEGLIRKEQKLPAITEEEIPFEIPATWKWVRMGDALNIVMGQSPKGKYVFDGKDGTEFHQGKRLFGDMFLLKSNQVTNKPTRIVSENTILLSVRAPVGAVNITKREICIGRGLSGISPFSGVDNKFIYYMLMTLEHEFNKKATGSTFSAITANVVKSQLFPLPPLEEQKRIVVRIEKLLSYTRKLLT
jgi:type I restriction enzyme S subunit